MLLIRYLLHLEFWLWGVFWFRNRPRGFCHLVCPGL